MTFTCISHLILLQIDGLKGLYLWTGKSWEANWKDALYDEVLLKVYSVQNTLDRRPLPRSEGLGLLWVQNLKYVNIINVMAADDLVTQGAKASVAMILILFPRKIEVCHLLKLASRSLNRLMGERVGEGLSVTTTWVFLYGRHKLQNCVCVCLFNVGTGSVMAILRCQAINGKSFDICAQVIWCYGPDLWCNTGKGNDGLDIMSRVTGQEFG